MGFWTPSPTSGAAPKVEGVVSTCMLLVSIAGGLPLLVINLYVPCYRLANPSIFNPIVTGLLLSIHAVLLSITLWSLARVKATNPGYVPRPHKLTHAEVRAIEDGNLEYTPPLEQHLLYGEQFVFCDIDGSPKFCDICKILRPARSSHCHKLGRCVIKFDHFCPTLFSAIGVGNHKYFIQFLFWGMGLATYFQVIGFVVLATLREGEVERGWFIALVMLASFAADIGILPLLALHFDWILHNVTTKEELGPKVARTPSGNKCVQVTEKPRVHKFVRCNLESHFLRYDIIPPVHCKFVVVGLDIKSRPWQSESKFDNWCSVMGTTWWEWILPVRPTRMATGNRKRWEFEFNERTVLELRRKVNEKLAAMEKGKMDKVFCPALVKES